MKYEKKIVFIIYLILLANYDILSVNAIITTNSTYNSIITTSLSVNPDEENNHIDNQEKSSKSTISKENQENKRKRLKIFDGYNPEKITNEVQENQENKRKRLKIFDGYNPEKITKEVEPEIKYEVICDDLTFNSLIKLTIDSSIILLMICQV
jgi:hypothetical protein